MIPVSQEILNLQAAQCEEIERIVRYRRRYFDIESQTYHYEAQWRELSSSSIKTFGKTKEELDAVQLNEFKIGSVSITALNVNNEWQENAHYGLWAADKAARLGYTPYRSYFQLAVAYRDRNGRLTEPVPLFYGFLSKMKFDGGAKTVQITLDSALALLDDKSAEEYSTRLTGELIGTGDGETTEFVTKNHNVGRVDRVVIDGFELACGADYNISDASEYELPAKITFEKPPSSGKEIYADYTIWHSDKDITDVVNDLLDLAGVEEREVHKVVFPNRILKRLYRPHPLCFRLKFDVLPDEDDFFLKEVTGGIEARVGAAGENLEFTPNGNEAGTIRYYKDVSEASAAVALSFLAAVINGASALRAGLGFSDGTELFWRIEPGKIRLFFGTRELGNISNAPGDLHSLLLYQNGETVYGYVDGVMMADAKIAAGAAAQLFMEASVPAAPKEWLDNKNKEKEALPAYAVLRRLHFVPDYGFALPGLPLVGVREYEVMDFTDDIKAFCLLSDVLLAEGGAGVSYEMQTSQDGKTWGAYQPVVASQILNVPERYGRIRVTRRSNLGGFNLPVLAEHNITFAKTRTTIRTVDVSAMSILDALQNLAELSGYVFGFDRTGVFFFRPRLQSSKSAHAVMEIHNRHVTEIKNVSDGTDNLYNEIEASFGEYKTVVNSRGYLLPEPTSETRYGRRGLSVGSDQFLIEKDADLAAGTAHRYFRLFSEPKKQFDIKTVFLPQIVVGDVLRVWCQDYYPQPPFRPWHIGDPSAFMGDGNLHFYGKDQMSLFGGLVQVLSVTHDPGNKMHTELKLEELRSESLWA